MWENKTTKQDRIILKNINVDKREQRRREHYKKEETENAGDPYSFHTTVHGFVWIYFDVFVGIESLTSMSSQSRDPDPYCSRH